MTPESPQDRMRDRLVFYPVAVIGAIFCITILINTTAMFGDSRAPVNRWFLAHGTRVILIETLLLVVMAILAMTLDRLRTLRRLRRSSSDSAVHHEVRNVD